jgi:soluble lytic murein transglycosylase-like protein
MKLVLIPVLLLLVAFSNRLHDQVGFSQQKTDDEILLFIKKTSAKYKVPVKLVHNIIKLESNWNHPQLNEKVGRKSQRSSKGAYGLMQLRLPTAKEVLETDTIVAADLLNNPLLNTEAGIRYLSKLKRHYDGNWIFAIAAYHRGPSRADNDIEKKMSPISKYVASAMSGVSFDEATKKRMRVELTKMSPKRKSEQFHSEVLSSLSTAKK